VGAPNVDKADRTSGVLIKTPTDLSSTLALAYGGTKLGLSRAHRASFFDVPNPVPLEELGGVPGEFLEGGKWCALTALFRGWDDDAIATVWPNTSTSGGTKVISAGTGESVRAGHLGTDRGIKLLYAPNNPQHRALIIYRAIPILLPEESDIVLSALGETAIEVRFVGVPDASGRVYKIGKLSELTL